MTYNIEKNPVLLPRRIRSNVGHCIDPDKPVIGICSEMLVQHPLDYHSHPRGQLAYASTGILKVHTAVGVWVVPSSQAVWIPGGLTHSVNAQTTAEIRHLFVDPAYLERLPQQCSVLDVSPLLQALILRVADFGRNYTADGPAARLCAVVLDEMQALRASPLYLPGANDRRVQRVMAGLIDQYSNESANHTSLSSSQALADWAARVGASERTLSRLFVRETAMTFQQWRRRLILQEAISQLGQGRRVTHVAIALGYRSTSAFVAMFKQALGKPPAQYCKELQ